MWCRGQVTPAQCPHWSLTAVIVEDDIKTCLHSPSPHNWWQWMWPWPVASTSPAQWWGAGHVNNPFTRNLPLVLSMEEASWPRGNSDVSHTCKHWGESVNDGKIFWLCIKTFKTGCQRTFPADIFVPPLVKCQSTIKPERTDLSRILPPHVANMFIVTCNMFIVSNMWHVYCPMSHVTAPRLLRVCHPHQVAIVCRCLSSSKHSPRPNTDTYFYQHTWIISLPTNIYSSVQNSTS